MNPIVKKYLQKQLFKQKGAIGSAKSVKFSYDALKTRMENLGLDINLIKTEKDLNQALGFVKNIEDQVFKEKFGKTLSKKDSATVFDLKGKKISDPNKIIGGEELTDSPLEDLERIVKSFKPMRPEGSIKKNTDESIKKNIAEATEKGDFTGIFNQVMRDKDIAREFMLSKKFPFRRDINVRSGEDAIPLARAAKFDEEMKKLNISATPGKDAKGTVEEFVDQMKKFGVKDKDIEMMLGSGKSGQVDYVMEQYGLSAGDVVDLLKQGKPLIEGLASGGRAGFKNGTPELKLFPRASGREIEKEVGPGIKVSERDLNYGITGLLEGDKFFGGAEIDKGKVKIDVLSPEGDTLFKDTIGKKDAVNFILGMGDPKGEKFQIKTDKDFENIQLVLKKSFAKGGRAGFKLGSPSKRSFLKVLGGIAATITALKSGLIGGGGKEITKQVVKESVKDVANAPPAYFFNLVNKIKKFGDEGVPLGDRKNTYNYKNYELTEDATTGEIMITKRKGDPDQPGYKEEVIEYEPGGVPEENMIKTSPKYEEGTITADGDGKMKNVDLGIEEDGIKEIIKDSEEVVVKKQIKRAGGGVAYMLGE